MSYLSGIPGKWMRSQNFGEELWGSIDVLPGLDSTPCRRSSAAEAMALEVRHFGVVAVRALTCTNCGHIAGWIVVTFAVFIAFAEHCGHTLPLLPQHDLVIRVSVWTSSGVLGGSENANESRVVVVVDSVGASWLLTISRRYMWRVGCAADSDFFASHR